jgi:hypothetical protein
MLKIAAIVKDIKIIISQESLPIKKEYKLKKKNL